MPDPLDLCAEELHGLDERVAGFARRRGGVAAHPVLAVSEVGTLATDRPGEGPDVLGRGRLDRDPALFRHEPRPRRDRVRDRVGGLRCVEVERQPHLARRPSAPATCDGLPGDGDVQLGQEVRGTAEVGGEVTGTGRARVGGVGGHGALAAQAVSHGALLEVGLAAVAVAVPLVDHLMGPERVFHVLPGVLTEVAAGDRDEPGGSGRPAFRVPRQVQRMRHGVPGDGKPARRVLGEREAQAEDGGADQQRQQDEHEVTHRAPPR
ncbi:MAG: hypothetical protein HOQ43_10850 [Glycomyces artemisiae]|uniref:Uncharacterized protein n=1 Tax=Glycomyces artemisiae TaxID=1076443 RepID=A0A850C6Q0_9ACTN|nr:hypothetical protein [Glycomyces artemisiae]